MRIKRNDHKLKKLSIFRQIFLTHTIENVFSNLGKTCVLMLGCTGLIMHFINLKPPWFHRLPHPSDSLGSLLLLLPLSPPQDVVQMDPQQWPAYLWFQNGKMDTLPPQFLATGLSTCDTSNDHRAPSVHLYYSLHRSCKAERWIPSHSTTHIALQWQWCAHQEGWWDDG